jgi:hypothetical protein
VLVCGHLLADIVGSNFAGGMDPSFWQALSDVFKWGSLRLADQSARVIPSVVCLECDLETSRTRRPRAQCLSNHENVFFFIERCCVHKWALRYVIKSGLYSRDFFFSSGQMTGKRS